MVRGIAVFGLNGSGKSTLAHALARRTGWFEMDAEDYYFPEQRASRQWALENDGRIETEHLGEIPFSVSRSKDEAQRALVEDAKAHPRFIITGVSVNWCDEILDQIDIAFWVQTPLDVRMRRIQEREEKRFGARVLAGGDMYAQQAEFRRMAASRDLKSLEEGAARLSCPVAVIDGALPVGQNLEAMMDCLNERMQ